MRQTFATFDKNDDGYISKGELMEVMSNFGQAITDEEIDQMIKLVDVDGK